MNKRNEKEIEQAIDEEFKNSVFEDESDFISQTSKFRKGIKWADEHPLDKELMDIKEYYSVLEDIYTLPEYDKKIGLFKELLLSFSKETTIEQLIAKFESDKYEVQKRIYLTLGVPVKYGLSDDESKRIENMFIKTFKCIDLNNQQ